MGNAVQVHIESMAFKGYGVARVNGQVCFIPYSVTGDKAWVQVTKKKKNFSIGKLYELIELSPLRTIPLCPSFGTCGGCQWQHITYSFHGELKKAIFEDILKRLGGLKEIPPIDVIPSSQPYGYRTRVQLKAKEGKIGYYQEKSHQLVEIHHCPIAHPLINKILSSLQKTSSFFNQIEEIEINVSPEQGEGVLLLHSLSFSSDGNGWIDKLIQAHPALKGVVLKGKQETIYFGDPFFNLTVSINQNGKNIFLKLRISPESFFQVNLEQNLSLIQTVFQFSEVSKGEKVLDLYAGVGNLSFPLAIVSKEVWAIEENRSAIEDARFNAKNNGIKNYNVLFGRVEDTLKHWRGENPDLIILDPPRTGCKTILDQVIKLNPQKIIYVSCEPTTFARDLRYFSERGYTLQRIALIDMFPQTYHMEVVGLIRSSSLGAKPRG